MSQPEWRIGDKKSFTHQFTREQVEQFAALTGDRNPVHLDDAYARRTPLGAPVVHGMLAASYISTLVGMHLPGPGALWTSFQVDWRHMIRVGDTLEFEAEILQISQSTQTMEIKLTAKEVKTGKECLTGKGKVMMMEEPKREKKKSMKGERILVTGASGEVGAAVCRSLAALGCRLILWGRNMDRLKKIAKEFPDQCEQCESVDLNQPKIIASALKKIADGKIYGFVHAASAPIVYSDVDQASNQEALQQQWQITVGAFNQIALSLIPRMNEGGVIIPVLTQYVESAVPPKISAYVSAKTALWGLVRCMANELGIRGIRCNAVSPSMINTPFSMEVPVRMKQIEANRNPMKHLCQVEDVADAVAYLVSPKASFVNGVNLAVTGGL